MKITVVVPLYYGEKYIGKLIDMFENNKKNLGNKCELQIIFVKDSMETVDFNKYLNCGLDIIFLQNEKNMGIHYSRVRGISVSDGDYVHMLDQDDEIADDFYVSFLGKLGMADVIVSNGIEQRDNYDKLLYKYYFMHYTVKFSYFYVKYSCRIISPGQCLVKKTSIPAEWKENILQVNGADDAMLWLMMLYKGSKFALNRHLGYIHVNTGVNVSSDSDLMHKSVKEMLLILKETQLIAKADIKRLEKQLVRKNKTLFIRIIEKINRK